MIDLSWASRLTLEKIMEAIIDDIAFIMFANDSPLNDAQLAYIKRCTAYHTEAEAELNRRNGG